MALFLFQMIELKALSIGYKSGRNEKIVAQGIRLSIFPGELTCLLGPNGAGKSTLLRTLSAFIPKLSGQIFIQGKEIEDYTNSALSKVIGVVLTEKVTVQNLTVRELVNMGRCPYTGFWGRLDDEDRRVVSESIALVGIEDLGEREIRTLSDGERQKVMIAKALAQETPIIFLDEPTAFLDFPSKVEIMRLLLRLTHQANKTIFLSTHDLELALQLSNRLWLMRKGGDITVGTSEELSSDGTIGHFFSNDGIGFDAATKRFTILP